MALKKLLRFLFWGNHPGNEREINKLLERLESAKIDASEPTLRFKRSWAYGNAGLEDETITREQVEAAMK